MIRAEEYARILGGAPQGKWIALSEDESRIVGTGNTMREAIAAAARSGVDEPVLIKLPSYWEHQISKTIH
jgi:hypothetical protein